MDTKVSSSTREVFIGDNHPTILIGERINPTGKPNLIKALKAVDTQIIRKEALDQALAGADIIDVNVSAFGLDEVTLLPQIVQLVTDTVDIPLCIDSPDPDAIAAALEVYNGKALINSVSGEERSLNSVLPLAKEYGAAVIGLVQDDEGIPRDSARRVSIAHKIVERADSAGIPPDDIIIDCLAFSVASDTDSGLSLLHTIRKIKDALGVNITLGVSNISFGLPNRSLLNSAFVAAAISAGATSLIVDVAKVRQFVLATDLLVARDKYARRYIEAYRKSIDPV